MRRSLYNERQLWLPLISMVPWLAPEPIDVVKGDYNSNDFAEKSQPAFNANTRIEWSENDTLRAHGGLLELSLNALTLTGNSAEKADVLNWVFTDWMWDWTYSPEGSRVTKTHAKTIPFSFLMCCEASGMDPEVIREYLVQRLKRFKADQAMVH